MAAVFSQMGRASARAAKEFQYRAAPVLRASAASWRRTVDETIAPKVKEGLVSLGQTTVDTVSSGMDTLADVLLEPETKAKTVETMSALGVIASSLMGAENATGGDVVTYEPQNPEALASQVYPQYMPHELLNQYQDIYYGPQQFIHDIDPRREEFYPSQPHPAYTNVVPHYVAPPETYPAVQASLVQADSTPNIPVARQIAHTNHNLPRDPSAHRVRGVEDAWYTVGKNLLGRNVTDRLFPYAKQVAVGLGQVGEGLSTIGNAIPIPTVEFDEKGLRVKTLPDAEDEPVAARDERNAGTAVVGAGNGGSTDQRITTSAPRCTTPAGGAGKCMDIQNCPLLLANLNTLRRSICFKSLFVPGVCCPDSGYVKSIKEIDRGYATMFIDLQSATGRSGREPERRRRGGGDQAPGHRRPRCHHPETSNRPRASSQPTRPHSNYYDEEAVCDR